VLALLLGQRGEKGVLRVTKGLAGLGQATLPGRRNRDVVPAARTNGCSAQAPLVANVTRP
jgi:hypothetical protein